MQTAGQASYAMYLSHQILMHASFHLLAKRGWGPWPAFTVAALLVALVGHGSFTFFESPVRDWLETRTGHWFRSDRRAG